MNDLLLGHDKDSMDSDTVKGWNRTNGFNYTKMVIEDTDTEECDETLERKKSDII